MQHPIADFSQADIATAERASQYPRLVRAVGDWSFIALTWILVLAILFYPTLHVIVFLGLSVRFLLLPESGAEGLRFRRSRSSHRQGGSTNYPQCLDSMVERRR